MTAASHKQSWVGVIALISLTWTSLPAQQARELAFAKRRVAGEVLDGSGEPWPDATVVLRSVPLVPIPELGPRDEVRVRANARGRFRAQLIAGRMYRAFASGETDGNAVRASEIVSVEEGAERVRLVESTEPVVPIELRVFGLAAWGKNAALWLIDDAFGRSQVADGARLRLPGESAWVELRSNAGAVLFRTWIPLRLKARKDRAQERADNRGWFAEYPPLPGLPDLAKQPAAGIGVETVLIPPPLIVPVTVQAAGNEQRVVGGAEVFCASLPSVTMMPTLARTGPDGSCDVVIAHPVDGYGYGREDPQARVELRVVANGFGITRFGWHVGRDNSRDTFDAAVLATHRAKRWTVDVEPTKVVTGTVFGERGAPLPGVAIVYHVHGPSPTRTWVESGVRIVRSDAHGKYSIPGSSGSGMLTIAAVLPPELWTTRDLPSARDIPTARLWPIASGRGLVAGPHDVDLRGIAPVSLAIRLPDGGSAKGALVSAYRTSEPYATGSLRTAIFLPRTRADRRGRCRILLDRRNPELFVGHARHFASVRLDKERAARALEVELEPCLTVAGQVRDADGAPLAAAWLAPRVTGRYWSDGPGHWIQRFNLEQLRAQSDRKGKFRLFFAPGLQQAYELRSSVLVDSVWQWSTDMVRLGVASVEDAELNVNH